MRSFNLILSLDYLNLPPEHLVTSLSDITNLYRWGDPLSEINKFINRMEAETAAARQNFINNYPEFNSGSDFLEYRGKRYNREEMISLLIKHSDFLKRLPPFKTANSDIKGLIATGDTGELRNYIDVHCRDYLDAYTRLSTAFQNGANEQIDYPSLLQALSKIKPALDSITELADKAQEHERIIIQREKEAAAAREAEQERQRQRQLSIQHTVEMLSAQLKRQLYKNMTLAQQVKEIIYKLEGKEQRVGQDKDDPRITTLRAISQEIFLPFEIKLQALNQLIVRSSEHLTVDTMEETKADLLRYVQETNQLVSSIPRQMTEQLSDKNLEALSLKKQNAFLRFIDQWLIRPFLSKRSDSFFATKMEKNLHGFREMFLPQNQIDPTPEGEIEDIKIPQRN
ncbi:hypothetical protein [Legionella birminghamensis]|uniref:hypothetical protein n=1 Tax=Legionella birminghamensis TaxID=28083 RepID=UPI000A5484EB|nr:hypothetical protein [Legionella birminghamensis]